MNKKEGKDMEQMLKDRVAIITGSGRGVGRSAAILFAQEGAKVVVNDIDQGPAMETEEKIKAHGGECMVVTGDLTAPGFAEKIIKKTIDRWGALHILVNNAGYTWDAMVHKMSDEQWEAMLAINLTAPFHLVRAAAPFFRDAARKEKAAGILINRKIINVSSKSGVVGMVGQTNYSAAKAGVIGFTKALAKEWGSFQVQINAVAFGWIETRLTEKKENNPVIERGDKKIPIGIFSSVQESVSMLASLGRRGTPEEAAGALLFLASPLSDYVTGHCLEVSGGA
jgi:3-oxoacyl-[acyl-carrier protein] reductase